MGGPHPQDRGYDLNHDVSPRRSGGDSPPSQHRERDGRVEVRARDRPEHADQDGQACARRQRIAQKRQSHIPAGQPLAHDPGADDDGQQQSRAQPFGDQAARQIEAVHPAKPDRRHNRRFG